MIKWGEGRRKTEQSNERGHVQVTGWVVHSTLPCTNHCCIMVNYNVGRRGMGNLSERSTQNRTSESTDIFQCYCAGTQRRVYNSMVARLSSTLGWQAREKIRSRKIRTSTVQKDTHLRGPKDTHLYYGSPEKTYAPTTRQTSRPGLRK